MSVILSSAFMPPISYFVSIYNSSSVIIDTNEFYIKQTFRNRTFIKTSQGVLLLTVPVRKTNTKPLVNEVEIDYSNNWDVLMLRTLKTAYGKSPFFEYYYDYIKLIFEKKHDRLAELNSDILTMCLKMLKCKIEINFSKSYMSDIEGYIDMRDEFFKINLSNQTYQQVFGNNFVSDLSILDLLFCEGPNATNILNKSITTK